MATLNMKWSEMNDDDLAYDDGTTDLIQIEGDCCTSVAYEGSYKVTTRKKTCYKPIQKSKLAMSCKENMIKNSKITPEMYKSTFDKEIFIEVARYTPKFDDDIDDAMDVRFGQPMCRDTVKEKFLQLQQLNSGQTADILMNSAGRDENAMMSLMPPTSVASKDIRGIGQQKEDCIIRVTNLSEDATDLDLSNLFEKCGVIDRIYLARDKETSKSKGYAFITYKNRESAEIAINKLDRHGHDNLLLRVEWAKPSTKNRE